MSYYCPHCAAKLEFIIRPKFCPECGESTAPGAKKAVAVSAPARSSATFRRPSHSHSYSNNQYEGEITEVPDIDGLAFSCDMDAGSRKFTIQDIMDQRISTAGRRDTTGEPKRDVLAEMQNEVKSSVNRLRSNESDEQQ